MTHLQAYFRDVAQVPLLTAAEEKAVATAARSGDAAARERLIRANLRLVVKVAKGLRVPRSLEDKIQDGNVGLIRAAEGFDPSRGIRFSTYSRYWIYEAIMKGVRQHGSAVRAPQFTFALWNRARKRLAAAGKDFHDLDMMTRADAASLAGLTPRQLLSVRDACRAASTRTFTDAADPAFDRPLEPVARPALPPAWERDGEMDPLRAAVASLPGNERRVLTGRFGLDGRPPMLLDELGDEFGVSRERIRQLETRALNRLRSQFGVDPRLAGTPTAGVVREGRAGRRQRDGVS